MTTRRRFISRSILTVIYMTVSSSLRATGTLAADERKYQFQWRVPKVHKETVQSELRFEGEIMEDRDSKGVLAFVFVGAVLLPYLANALLALRREIVHGGIVVDTRGKEIDVYTDKSLPGGVIIIVTPEGTQYHERDEFANPAELIGALKKGM